MAKRKCSCKKAKPCKYGAQKNCCCRKNPSAGCLPGTVKACCPPDEAAKVHEEMRKRRVRAKEIKTYGNWPRETSIMEREGYDGYRRSRRSRRRR